METVRVVLGCAARGATPLVTAMSRFLWLVALRLERWCAGRAGNGNGTARAPRRRTHRRFDNAETWAQVFDAPARDDWHPTACSRRSNCPKMIASARSSDEPWDRSPKVRSSCSSWSSHRAGRDVCPTHRSVGRTTHSEAQVVAIASAIAARTATRTETGTASPGMRLHRLTVRLSASHAPAQRGQVARCSSICAHAA